MSAPARGVALVTGASRGIGLACSVALGQAGFDVVATMRDPSGSGPLLARAGEAGVEVTVEALDVADDESVGRAAAAVLGRHGRVDVLVNNAGAGQVGTLEELTMAEIQHVFDVNAFGAARVTKAFLPAMRAQGGGRVIAVSSTAGVFGQPFNEAYCGSKFALEGIFESLAPVVAGFGINVALVEAGMVRTGFFESSTAGRRAAEGPYAEMYARFASVAAGAESAGQDPQEVAAVVVAAATDDPPRLRYQTGPAVTKLLARKLSDLDGAAVIRMTRSWLA